MIDFKPGAMDICTVSPDGRTTVVLEWLGEVHFGPAYFALWIQFTGQTVLFGPGRSILHGGTLAISPDSRYLLVERWANLLTPNTSAVVLDLEQKRENVAVHIGTGFLGKVEFPSDEHICSLQFDVFESNSWVCRQDRIDLPNLPNWTPLTWVDAS